MGPLTKRILLFTVALVVLYGSAFLVMGHVRFRGKALIYRTADYYQWTGGDSWQRFREYHPAVRQDAVIIGSSHAYRGYDPSVFAARGYRVFNLGSSAQTPLNSQYLIEAFLDSANAPLLVFDVYEGVFASTGFESTADLTQNLPSPAAAWGMVGALGDLRGLNMMALRAVIHGEAPLYMDKEYRGLGFVPRRDTLRKEPRPMSAPDPAMAGKQWKHFKAAIALCRERGIRVVVTSHWALPARGGEVHSTFVHQVRQALQGTGIPYVDLTDAAGSTDMDHYADDNHLNAAGAALFTAQLVDSLERRGYLR
jgi:hypothetical protein